MVHQENQLKCQRSFDVSIIIIPFCMILFNKRYRMNEDGCYSINPHPIKNTDEFSTNIARSEEIGCHFACTITSKSYLNIIYVFLLYFHWNLVFGVQFIIIHQRFVRSFDAKDVTSLNQRLYSSIPICVTTPQCVKSMIIISRFIFHFIALWGVWRV